VRCIKHFDNVSSRHHTSISISLDGLKLESWTSVSPFDLRNSEITLHSTLKRLVGIHLNCKRWRGRVAELNKENPRRITKTGNPALANLSRSPVLSYHEYRKL
jgi:hypothetical protein